MDGATAAAGQMERGAIAAHDPCDGVGREERGRKRTCDQDHIFRTRNGLLQQPPATPIPDSRMRRGGPKEEEA
jgi:hypothetical protein